MVSNGSKQIMFGATMASVNPGDEVIIPSPGWISYADQVKLAGGVPVAVSCPENNQFKLRAADLDAAITPKRLLEESVNQAVGAGSGGVGQWRAMLRATTRGRSARTARCGWRGRCRRIPGEPEDADALLGGPLGARQVAVDQRPQVGIGHLGGRWRREQVVRADQPEDLVHPREPHRQAAAQRCNGRPRASTRRPAILAPRPRQRCRRASARHSSRSRRSSHGLGIDGVDRAAMRARRPRRTRASPRRGSWSAAGCSAASSWS